MKFALTALALLLLTGGAEAQSLLTRGNGSEPDSLDPHFARHPARGKYSG